MSQREGGPSAAKKAFIISPNPKLAADLDALLQSHLGGTPVSHIRNYPSPRDVASALGSASPLVLLDIVSDPQQSIQLLGEMVRAQPAVQVIALLGANEPDLILGCLRAGAVDFLIQPFTSDQIEAALSKLARRHPSS